MSRIVYGLCDPRTGALRYIGKTTGSLKRRYNHHISNAALAAAKKTHKSRWIMSLKSLGLTPVVVVIRDGISDADLNEAERHHIRQFKSAGCRLTNGTDGGDGASGYKHTRESKDKSSKSQKGRTLSIEHRLKISIAMKSHGKQNPEHVKKRTAWMKGREISREHREKLRKANLGKKIPPSVRDKMADSIRRYWAQKKACEQ